VLYCDPHPGNMCASSDPRQRNSPNSSPSSTTLFMYDAVHLVRLATGNCLGDELRAACRANGMCNVHQSEEGGELVSHQPSRAGAGDQIPDLKLNEQQQVKAPAVSDLT
jgi:hypothetical protein